MDTPALGPASGLLPAPRHHPGTCEHLSANSLHVHGTRSHVRHTVSTGRFREQQVLENVCGRKIEESEEGEKGGKERQKRGGRAPPEGARARRKQLGSPGRPGRPPRTPSVLSPVSAGWPGASPGPEPQLLLLPAPGDPGGQAVPPTSPPVYTLEERDSLVFIRGSRGATSGHMSTPVTVPMALALATVLPKTVEKPKGHGQPRPGPDDG